MALNSLKRYIQIITLGLFLFCTRHDYNPKLVEYLKAERELRKTITESRGLNDSLVVLQKRFHIDINKELNKLKKNPQTWLKIFKELNDGK